MRERPLLAVAAAAIAAAALGGLVFSRLGRLAFAVALGFTANELWRTEGRFDLEHVMRRIPGRRSAETAR